MDSLRSAGIIVTVLAILLFSRCKNNDLPEVRNVTPRYHENTFVSFEKIYSIDVTDLSMASRKMEDTRLEKLAGFDSKNNMYILDPQASQIFVFNEGGKRVNVLGRPGHGPGDLNKPNVLRLDSDKLYVFQ